MNLRNSLKTALVFVLGLPLLLVVLQWVAGLVTAMGDNATAHVLGHLGTACRVLWLVALVGTIVVLALQSLDHSRDLE